MAASCITLTFLRNWDESGDPLHRRQLMGSLIGGPFYMLAIYVAFSWVELFKPNKTKPFWACSFFLFFFFKSCSCGKQDSEGYEAADGTDKWRWEEGGGGRGPVVASPPPPLHHPSTRSQRIKCQTDQLSCKQTSAGLSHDGLSLPGLRINKRK